MTETMIDGPFFEEEIGEEDIIEPQVIHVDPPYMDEVHEENIRFLNQDVDVVVSTNLGLETDKETSRVSQNYLRMKAKELIDHDDSIDTLMIGCSAFQACTSNGFIDSLESELGVRVVTSQQAFLWDMCKTCDVDTSNVVGYGELMRV